MHILVKPHFRSRYRIFQLPENISLCQLPPFLLPFREVIFFFFYDFYVPKSTPQHFLTIKKEITKYFCCLANFNNLNVVLGLPMLLYVSIFQPFYFWGVFHYMNVSQFIYPFFCSWILIWSFPEWPIVNNLSMNWINVLNFLQYTTNNGITMSTY